VTAALLGVLLLEAAPQPQPSGVVAGVEAFGTCFPRSMLLVPSDNELHQQSVLTGPRVWVGYSHHERFRVIGTFEGGYVAAGKQAGDGADGFSVGGGLEGDWVLHRWLMPFLRLTYDVLLAQRVKNPTGTLATAAFSAALGVRALRFLDVDFCVGHDFAGGWSYFGIGAALGWSWLVPFD
jgi:hypothetical protein